MCFCSRVSYISLFPSSSAQLKSIDVPSHSQLLCGWKGSELRSLSHALRTLPSDPSLKPNRTQLIWWTSRASFFQLLGRTFEKGIYDFYHVSLALDVSNICKFLLQTHQWLPDTYWELTIQMTLLQLLRTWQGMQHFLTTDNYTIPLDPKL